MASSASTVQEVIIEKNEEDLGDEKEKAETSEESRVAALEERVKGWLLSSKSWLQHKWDAVPEEYKFVLFSCPFSRCSSRQLQSSL